MDRQSLIQLVRRFLHGSASAEEQRFLEEYDTRFDKDPVHMTSEETDTELEAELFDRINSEIKRGTKRRGQVYLRLTSYGIAASVALLIGVWLFYTGRLRSERFTETTSENISIHVKPGSTRKVTLPDGTRVTINAGSTLTYPVRFGVDTRPVTLDGEAYFDVAHNAEKPFLVTTSHLTVQVLGTRFNVSSYPQNSENQIAVMSGKVSVTAHTSNEQPVILLPQQQAVYQLQTNQLKALPVDTTEILGWQRDQLIFRNQRMDEVARALERKYDIRLTVDREIRDCRIYAKINSDSPEKTLRAIATLLNASVQTEGNISTIKGKGCS